MLVDFALEHAVVIGFFVVLGAAWLADRITTARKMALAHAPNARPTDNYDPRWINPTTWR